MGQLAYDVLRPGGILITTVGHKAVMFSGPVLAPLKPLHVLVLRRLPGHTRSIVGTNMASASVLCILAYKPPFRARSSMVVDLQSWGGEDPLPGLEEIPSGIERGFDQFLLSLVEPNDYVAHVVCGSAKEQFGIRESLKASSLNAGAGAFLSIG